jgi:ankyrin repeat protein
LQNTEKNKTDEYVSALEQSLADLCTGSYRQKEIVVSAKLPLELMRKVPKLKNLCRHIILRNLNLSVFKSTCIKLTTAKTLQDFIFYNTKFSKVSTLSLSDVHIAAYIGDLESLALKLNSQIVNIKFHGVSLLEVTISRKCIPGTSLLLENGADPNGETKEEVLPLHLASRQCCPEIVQILLKFGANVNAVDKPGNLPIHEACISGHFNIAELLIQHGSIYDSPDINGRHPIHYSCASGNWEFTNILLKLGVNGDTTDKCGHTGLHLAASRGNLYLIQNIELPYMFKTDLLMKGYMFVLMYSCNIRCVSKPKYTSQVDHIKVIESLLTAGCSHVTLSGMNKSAFDIARDFGFTDIMTILQVCDK